MKYKIQKAFVTNTQSPRIKSVCVWIKIRKDPNFFSEYLSAIKINDIWLDVKGSLQSGGYTSYMTAIVILTSEDFRKYRELLHGISHFREWDKEKAVIIFHISHIIDLDPLEQMAFADELEN